MYTEVVLQPKDEIANNKSFSFNSNQEQNLIVDNLSIYLPANSLVTENGSQYNGEVKAEVLYLSPLDNNLLDLMPGELQTDKDQQLITYGMTEINLKTQTGETLSLKSGAESELVFAVPDELGSKPAEIPMWYFDEEKAWWTEVGMAVLTDGVYKTKVTHFSWYNLDNPEDRSTIKGRVVDCQNNPLTKIKVTAAQKNLMTDYNEAYTNNNGEFEIYIPNNMEIVLSAEFLGQSALSPVTIPVQTSSGLIEKTLTLSCAVTITGQVLDCQNDPAVRAVSVKYNNQTNSKYSNAAGKYTLYVPANTKSQLVSDDKVYEIDPKPAGTIVEQNVTSDCAEDIPYEAQVDVDTGSIDALEAVSIKYQTKEGNLIITFDNYGKRIRVDNYYSNSNNHTVSVIDLLNQKILKYDNGAWELFDDQTQLAYFSQFSLDALIQQFVGGASQVIESFKLMGSTMAMAGIKTESSRVNITGKNVEVLSISLPGQDCAMRFGSWNGLGMIMEECEGVVLLTEKIVFDVPNDAFAEVVDPYWIESVSAKNQTISDNTKGVESGDLLSDKQNSDQTDDYFDMMRSIFLEKTEDDNIINSIKQALENKIEKLSIKFELYDSSTELKIFKIITFDNYGERIRFDSYIGNAHSIFIADKINLKAMRYRLGSWIHVDNAKILPVDLDDLLGGLSSTSFLGLYDSFGFPRKGLQVTFDIPDDAFTATLNSNGNYTGTLDPYWIN